MLVDPSLGAHIETACIHNETILSVLGSLFNTMFPATASTFIYNHVAIIIHYVNSVCMQHPRSVTFSKMSRLLTCPMASVVLLTALLLAAGSVVCGSPTDQNWFNHDPTWSWTDCCECIIVMYFDSNKY